MLTKTISHSGYTVKFFSKHAWGKHGVRLSLLSFCSGGAEAGSLKAVLVFELEKDGFFGSFACEMKDFLPISALSRLGSNGAGIIVHCT